MALPSKRHPDPAQRAAGDDPFLEFEPERTTGFASTPNATSPSARAGSPPAGPGAARPKLRVRVPANPWLIAALFVIPLAAAAAVAMPAARNDAWSRIKSGASALVAFVSSSSFYTRSARGPFPTSTDPVGPPTVEAIAPAASTSPAVAPPTTIAPEVILRPGTVTFRVPLDLEVYHQGRLVGTTGAGVVTLPAGATTVTLVSDSHELRQTQSVTVTSGGSAAVTVRLPNGRLSVNALPWAEVFADGELLGTTPLANVPLRVGTHEIVWRHPTLGERRQTVLIKARTPARVGVDFSR